MTKPDVTFKVAQSLKIAEWLRDHGYAPAKAVEHPVPKNKWCVIATDEFTNWDWRVWALHGQKPKWWQRRGRRAVGEIYFGPPHDKKWEVSLYGDDGHTMLFKRMMEKLSADFDRPVNIQMYDSKPRYEAHVGLVGHLYV